MADYLGNQFRGKKRLFWVMFSEIQSMVTSSCHAGPVIRENDWRLGSGRTERTVNIPFKDMAW